MSRARWEQQGKRTYAMGVCLLHRRPVKYEEGLRKGCVSRRRCKWFRGPNEGGPPPALPEDGSCPADLDGADEIEEEAEAQEKEYECDACGARFSEPAAGRESRGEFWGGPAYEETKCCPRCGAAGLMEVQA